MVKAMDHTPLAPRERPSAPPLWNLVNLLNVPAYVCLLSEAYSKPGLLGSYGRAYTSDFSKKFGVYSYRWRVLEPNQRAPIVTCFRRSGVDGAYVTSCCVVWARSSQAIRS
jgi:hypothetical protein